jgi:phosphopantothenoylcysteine decarboxylase/phosphopantothenate--cysteine ligase
MSLVALGVTGGIGAYKAVEVARGLQKRGHEVVALMTRSARRFVGPVTFEAITRRRVITDQWAPGMNADIEHIALTTEIDLLLIAPATANIIAKLAHGIADDFLTSFVLALRKPILLAPAMNTNMFEHPAVQANLATLSARGVQFVDPGSGYLACGWIGKGRLAEPEEIAEAAHRMMLPVQSLTGRKLLVTAGPTYENIDPVRFIGNRSSGRMGVAIAAEAARRGADVTLVLGPSSLDLPPVRDVVRVRSAADMHAAVMARAKDADVVIMAAAVADYTPADGAEPQKIAKKGEGLTLTLTKTRDILADLGRARAEGGLGAGARAGLASVGGRSPLLVGFAAETHDVIAHAREKLARKQIDLIVANDVARADAGFEVDTNAATLISHDDAIELPLQSKQEMAGRILDRVTAMLRAEVETPPLVAQPAPQL